MVTYEYYLGSYGGRHITSSDFARMINRSWSWVNYLTANRLDPQNLSDSVKMAICEIADALEKLDQNGGRNVTHESVGTAHSVTYEPSHANPELQRAHSILIRHIGHTGLMYRGR